MGGCPGIGTGTQSHGTVPLVRSGGTRNPAISGKEYRSVQGRSCYPGILRNANPTLSREAIYFFYREECWTDLCQNWRESRSVPTLFVSRGTEIGAEVCGTSGTGTNFRGSVPHGCPEGQVGSG